MTGWFLTLTGLHVPITSEVFCTGWGPPGGGGGTTIGAAIPNRGGLCHESQAVGVI